MWNKRQERSQSKTSSTGTDVPVTNIDDVVLRSSSSRGSSRPVFDSRKAMAGKRKVRTTLGHVNEYPTMHYLGNPRNTQSMMAYDFD